MKQILIITLLLVFAWGTQAKTTYYVKQGATGTGTSWTDASGNPQAMINKAAIGDEIWVAHGTYYPNQPVTNATDPRDRSFVMREGISLYGGFLGTENSIEQRELVNPAKRDSIGYCDFKYATVLNGDFENDDEWIYNDSSLIWTVNYNRENAYHVVYYKPTTICDTKTVFDGFTVKGGGSSDYGGGIYFLSYNSDSKGIVRNCILKNNSGGGAQVKGDISNCSVYHNVGGDGGGLRTNGCNVVNCSIFKNNGGKGGGIYGGNISKIENCEIYNNYSGAGGGVCLTSSSEINHSKIHNNICESNGGGVFSEHNGTTKNCLIYSNKSNNDGGGVTLWDSQIINCKIFNNSADAHGGIDIIAGASIINCIIFNNSARYCSAIGNSWNPNGGNNCILFNNKNGNTGASGALGENNMGQNSIFGGVNNPVSIYLSRKNVYLSSENDPLSTTTLENLKFIRPSSFEGLATTPAQLEELLNTDWHIQEGSVCIDAGMYAGAPATDFDENPRPLGNGVDIGAYEYVKYNNLPFIENFEGDKMKFFTTNWVVNSLANSKQGYYEGKSGVTNYSEELFTSYFIKPDNGAVNLSYDLNFKRSSAKTTLEELAVVIIPLGSTVGDTIVIHNNQGDNFISHFSFNTTLPVACKYFKLTFIARGANAYNIYWWALDNIELSELKDVSIITVATSSVVGGTANGGGTYVNGTSCTVTAKPNADYTFTNWTENGTVVSTNAIYTFTVNASRNLTANFSTDKFIVSTTANPISGGTLTGAGAYNYGESCTLIATPATGYSFANWSENGIVVSTSANYTFSISRVRSLIANFALNSYKISATANPADGGKISGTGTYNYGTSCTIIATPNTGYEFIGWSDYNSSLTNSNISYTFTVTGNKDFLAKFIYTGTIGSGIATLPVFESFSTVTTSSIGTLPNGFSQSNVQGYVSALKFATTGAYLLLHFDSSPGILNFDLGVNNVFPGAIPSTAAFVIEESSDGVTWTNCATYSNTDGGTKTISNLKTSSRYIRWTYSNKPTGTNIALKNINLAAFHTGIKDVSAENIFIYSLHKNIVIENAVEWNISVVDLFGKIIQTKKIEANKFEIPVSQTGIFAVFLSKEGKTCSRKVIINQ